MRFPLLHPKKVFANSKAEFECYLHQRRSKCIQYYFLSFCLISLCEIAFINFAIIDMYMFIKQFFNLLLLNVSKMLSFKYICQ